MFGVQAGSTDVVNRVCLIKPGKTRETVAKVGTKMVNY